MIFISSKRHTQKRTSKYYLRFLFPSCCYFVLFYFHNIIRKICFYCLGLFGCFYPITKSCLLTKHTPSPYFLPSAPLFSLHNRNLPSIHIDLFLCNFFRNKSKGKGLFMVSCMCVECIVIVKNHNEVVIFSCYMLIICVCVFVCCLK